MSAVCLSLFLAAVGAQAEPQPDSDGIGLHILDFTARDHLGREHSLRDFKDSKLVVVVFLSVDCPLSKLYGARLAELANDFGGRGVAVVGIHANPHEALTSLTRYVRELKITFPLLRDLENDVVNRFGARRTPEAFILDERRAIRYRGRIDDQYGIGIQRQTVAQRDMAEALEELQASKAVSRPVTQPVGCLINRRTAPAKASVTFTKDIAPLLQKRCQECHRPGQVAPFPLTTYKEAAARSAMIREVVEQGRMPPWSANPHHGKFANDPSLTALEKKVFLDWIDAACPEKGDSADLPSPTRQFAEGWNIPQPDQVVSMREPFTVPAQGVIEYQYFEVDPGFQGRPLECEALEDSSRQPSGSAPLQHLPEATRFDRAGGAWDPGISRADDHGSRDAADRSAGGYGQAGAGGLASGVCGPLRRCRIRANGSDLASPHVR